MSDQRLVVVDPQVVLGRARVFHRTHWISIHERLGGGSKYEVVIGIAGGYRSCNQGEREDVIFSTLVHSLGGLKMGSYRISTTPLGQCRPWSPQGAA